MTTNIEKFKLIKGNKTYYLGSEGNIKDSYKNGIEFVDKFKKETIDNLSIKYILNTPSPSL